MRKWKPLTVEIYIGNQKVDKLPEEYLEKMCERVGAAMSAYYTAHPEEYKKI